MDVIIMRSTSSLIHKLKTDYPQFTFFDSDSFSWNPTTKTIAFQLQAVNAAPLLLHELGHALLGHDTYRRDVELVAMESAAWEEARKLAATYTIRYSEADAQDHLDTYRDWLHARSTCPKCTATGYQNSDHHYRCPACGHEWRVNDARVCALRRYSKKLPH